MEQCSCSLAATVVVFSICAGCNNPVYFKTAPVRGVLTCQSKPVPGVRVVFSPQAGGDRTEITPGKSAIGTTDEEGNFVLSTYEMNDGAVVGVHIASVTFDDEPGNPYRPVIRKLLPPCLNETRTIEIKPGTNEVRLDLGK